MATDNLFNAVERLEQITAKFERLMYGEPPERPGGLLAEVEGLRKDVERLHVEVQRIKARRPNVGLWVFGFLSFVGGIMFGVVGLLNQIDGHNVWNMPPTVALWLAGSLCLGSLMMFLGGFGWLERGA